MGLTQKLGTIPLAILTDASNNVGIGAAPSGSYKLEVTGTAKVSSTLLVSGAATFSSSVSTGGADQGYQLDVKRTSTGDSTFDSIANFYKASTNATQLLIRAKNGLIDFAGSYVIGGGGPQTALSFSVSPSGGSPTEAMRITSGGLVGIGTSTPSVKLQVEDSSSTSLNILYLVNSSTAAVTTKQNNLSFRMTDTAGTRKNAFQLTAYSDSAGGNIENGGLIFTGRKADVDTEYMRITSGGISVFGHTAGVGTNFSPPVQVKGGAGSGNGFGIISANNEIAGGIQLASSGLNSINITCDPDNLRASSEIGFLIDNSVKMLITSAGNVGIGGSGFSDTRFCSYGSDSTASNFCIVGKNAAGSDLFVARNDGVIFTGTLSGSPYNNSVTGRDAYLSSSGVLGYLSSTRESKTNINSVSDINWISELNPVSFNYRKKDDEMNYTEEFFDDKSFGFIADEVEKVNPDFVFYDINEDGTKKLAGVKYQSMTAVLTKAIQELNERLNKAGL